MISKRAVRLAALATFVMVASCNDCDRPKETPKDAAIEVVPDASRDVSAPTPPKIDAAPSDAGASTIDAGDLDAGPSACRLAYGPAEQPFRGPAALVTTPTEVRLVANDSGKPRIFAIPIASPTPPKPTSFVGMRWPPCEIAGRWAYCQGPGGAIVRSTISPAENGEAKEIVKGRAGDRIAAAALGPNHSVVAYLTKKKTSEGDQLQAFAVVDDGEPARLSDDGAGATAVRLVPRGAEDALAVYIDSRTSMVPVHVRAIAAKGNTLAPSADVVIHVSGPPERGVDFAIAGASGSFFVLLPNAKDTALFGMSAIPISDPPKIDEQPIWSFYPNGLDPAPIAATITSAKGAFVARVRPREAMPGSLRVLELGKLDAQGAFTSLGVIAQGDVARHVTDITMTTDATGAIWILYGDTTITWLERRVCP